MRGVLLILGISLVLRIQGDVVECENGDRYNGKVLLVDQTQVKLTNDITGVLTIPRAKVSTISFGKAKPPRPIGSALTRTNLISPVAPSRIDPNAIQQVQNQWLGDASPEATQMYQEMIRGLMSGQLDLGDLRNKALSTLNELKGLQKDLGDDDAAALLSSYAGILEGFINQAPVKPQTPAAVAPKKSEE
jgi:hypothetical protein